MIEYNKSNISLAKDLRKNMTRQERKLWYEFLRDYKPRFQRQKAIGDYIVDFYCAKARIVLELDGNQHYETEEKIEYDFYRTEYLKSKNLQVIRISNYDIDKNFEGVCCLIDKTVKESLPQSAEADSSLVRGSQE